MTIQDDRIAVCILCDEAASLFGGGENHPRFGGAGVHMYFLAKGLAENPRFQVFLILGNVTAHNLCDDAVEFLEIPSPARQSVFPYRRLPLISRLLSRRYVQRIRSLYNTLPEKRVFISTMALFASHLKRQASLANAKAIFQTASETDVTRPRGCSEQEAQSYVDAIVACDTVFVQTDKQAENLLSGRNRSSLVVRKGFPAPARIPDSVRDGVIWVGSAQAPKQPWVACYLAMLCPDIPFTIILPPAEEGVSLTIRVLAEDLPNVTLIDHQIGYDDAQQYFDTASVFLYSGVVGTDPPITLLQAAMGGSMIVSTYLDPDNEMLSEGGCGILERDYTRAAEIIKRACTDESFRLLYVKRAFEYVTTHYGYDTMLDSYTQEIERLAAL